MYSNGLSEVMLGNAIKELQLPREELVILTKVYFPVASKYDLNTFGHNPEELGIINQKGLSRKVCNPHTSGIDIYIDSPCHIAYLRLCQGEPGAPTGRLHRFIAV